MEDKLLVLRCKRGSSDALARIYEKYRRDLLILAIALLNDVGAAEDVVHDVFVNFVEALARFHLTGSLKRYLLTCAANNARNRNKARERQQNVRHSPAQSAGKGSDDPVQSIIYNEQLQQFGDAMTQLPYPQREAIILHVQVGMRFRAIADLRGMSVNTIKSRYRYGLDKLRSILNHEAKDETSRSNTKTD